MFFSDRLQPPPAGTGVTNMYSYSAGSLARREASRGGRHELEDMLQEVDEVAVTSRQSRVSSSAAAISSLPRTFTSYRATNRGEEGEHTDLAESEPWTSHWPRLIII